MVQVHGTAKATAATTPAMLAPKAPTAIARACILQPRVLPAATAWPQDCLQPRAPESAPQATIALFNLQVGRHLPAPPVDIGETRVRNQLMTVGRAESACAA